MCQNANKFRILRIFEQFQIIFRLIFCGIRGLFEFKILMQEAAVNLPLSSFLYLICSLCKNCTKNHFFLARNSIIIHVTTFQNVFLVFFLFFVMQSGMKHAFMHYKTKKGKDKKTTDDTEADTMLHHGAYLVSDSKTKIKWKRNIRRKWGGKTHLQIILKP